MSSKRKQLLQILNARIDGVLIQAESLTAVQHSGLAGRLREILATELIEPLLKPDWRVTTGVVMDSEGVQSGQEDIIIYSTDSLPELFQFREASAIPIEACLAVLEVKTTLDNKELKKAISHAQQIRSLSIKSFVRTDGKTKLLDRIGYPLYGVFGFATDLRTGLPGERKRLQRAETAHHARYPVISAMYVVGSGGLVLNHIDPPRLNQLKENDYTSISENQSSAGVRKFLAFLLSSLSQFNVLRAQNLITPDLYTYFG